MPFSFWSASASPVSIERLAWNAILSVFGLEWLRGWGASIKYIFYAEGALCLLLNKMGLTKSAIENTRRLIRSEGATSGFY